MRFLVIMSDNRPLSAQIGQADYNSLTAAINYDYCRIHNHGFRYYQPYLETETEVVLHNCVDPATGNPRHASWSKLLSTELALTEALQTREYDYVVYIDSDCIFKNFGQTLQEVLAPYAENEIVFTNNEPSSAGPCAGFYACKVTPYALRFVKKWYDTYIPQRNIARVWEQAALTRMYKSYNVGLMDNGDFFHERSGQFLRHVISSTAHKRIPYFLRFLTANRIPYSPSAIDTRPFRTTAPLHCP